MLQAQSALSELNAQISRSNEDTLNLSRQLELSKQSQFAQQADHSATLAMRDSQISECNSIIQSREADIVAWQLKHSKVLNFFNARNVFSGLFA